MNASNIILTILCSVASGAIAVLVQSGATGQGGETLQCERLIVRNPSGSRLVLGRLEGHGLDGERSEFGIRGVDSDGDVVVEFLISSGLNGDRSALQIYDRDGELRVTLGVDDSDTSFVRLSGGDIQRAGGIHLEHSVAGGPRILLDQIGPVAQSIKSEQASSVSMPTLLMRGLDGSTLTLGGDGADSFGLRCKLPGSELRAGLCSLQLNRKSLSSLVLAPDVESLGGMVVTSDGNGGRIVCYDREGGEVIKLK